MGLTDVLPVAEFYEQPWGTAYGNKHRGLDILRAASRPVPHLFPGTVVRRSSNGELGGFVVTDRGAGYAGRGRYIGYGHTVGGSGNDLGHVADYNEDHGSKWSAPHTHVTVSDSMYGIDTPSLPTYDPAPFVAQAISGFAGGGGTPSGPTTTIHPEDTMYKLFSRVDNDVVTLALGILDPNWQTKGRNFWAEAKATERRDWTEQWGQPTPLSGDIWNTRSNDPQRISDLRLFPALGGGTAAPWSPTPADLAAIGAAVKPTDLAPVLSAIAAGEAQDVAGVNAVLAAIAAVDEATLATFGLKRA